MTTWKINKNPYDFPAIFHKIAQAGPGKYEMVTFKSNPSTAKGWKERWKYFKWTVKQHHHLNLFNFMQARTYRLREDTDGSGFSTIWITVEWDDSKELILNLKKALKK